MNKVTRTMNGRTVIHDLECTCPFCDEYKRLTSHYGNTAIVTEQGMFGDLVDEFNIQNASSKKCQ